MLAPKTAAQRVRVAIDVRIDSGGLSGDCLHEQPIVIDVADNEHRIIEGIALELRTNGPEITTELQAFSVGNPGSEAPKSVAKTSVATLPLDRWVTVSIDVDLSSSSTLRATLAYDGQEAGEVSVHRASLRHAEVMLNVGSGNSSAHSGPAPCLATFDTLVFDVE